MLVLECDADDAPVEFVAGAELMPVCAVLVGVKQEHDEVEPGRGICDPAVERRGEDAGPSRVGVNASRGIGECPSQVGDGPSGDLSQQVEVWGPVTAVSAKDPEQVFVGQVVGAGETADEGLGALAEAVPDLDGQAGEPRGLRAAVRSGSGHGLIRPS
ncbi:hypothetical protein GCM10010449_05840 [Streptomyces rectiviolaceus]|uniref:Uncharacterized protein n=1 Tax=Streptomyces rectiviolaceus TaxID=332591 RepID=A0ABP6MBA3_9ACTN